MKKIDIRRAQRGEIASLLTIISMVVISIGIIAGARINQQASPVNTSPFAVDLTPTPINLGYDGGRWFEGSRGRICAAEFSCNSDPIMRTLQLRSPDGILIFDLDLDVTGRGLPEGTPVGKNITGSCSSRAFGISINWDPRVDYTPAQIANIRTETGYTIKKGQILLSMRQGPTRHRYFIYDRPAWLTGAGDAIFYMEFDAKTANVWKRYSQTALGKKGCGPDTPTPTLTGTRPTPTTPLPGTPTPTGPTPTGPTATPTPPGGGTPTGPAPSLTPITPPPGSPTPTTPLPGTPTPTGPTPTGPTATPTPSPTPGVQACEFQALAYVQECEPDGTGQCPRDASGNNFIAHPIDVTGLSGWGVSNNRQIEDGAAIPAGAFRFLNGNPTEKNTIITNFPYYAPILGNQLTYLMALINQPVPAGKNPSQVGSPYDLTPAGRTANPILIPQTATNPNRQYFNLENSFVRLTLPRPQYRVVPDGNEIPFCKNNLTGNFIGACSRTEFQNHRVDTTVDPATRDSRDTIAGLTVGCGQNIVYGWTVQKCQSDFDYVFVMDVSTSMLNTIDVTARTSKREAAIKELLQFLTDIKSSGSNSRVALIQFSSRTNTRTVTPLTDNIDTVILAAWNSLTYEEGTCIECGLRESINLLTNFRTDKSRKPVVIFLTDGLPNSDPGNPRAGGYEGEIRTESDRLKNLHKTIAGMDPVTVLGIGYGDPARAGETDPARLVNAELLRVIRIIASDNTWAYSTSARTTIHDIFTRISSNVNTCTIAKASYLSFQKSKDLNGDGIINTVDLFAIYDAYFQKGDNIKEDINQDGTVNALDVSLIATDLGTVITPESEE